MNIPKQWLIKASKEVAKVLSNLFKDARKRLKQAVQLTQWLKKAIDSDTTDLILDMIPSDMLISLRYKLSRMLAEALKILGVTTNLTFIGDAGISILKGKNRGHFLKLIAGKIAERDLNIDEDSAIEQTQLIYATDPAFA